jgi:putative ABC transport system permease protein
VRPSVRGLLRSWRIHVAVVVSLSVAYGVIVFATSLFDALLWRPLPVPEAERLVTIGVQNADGAPDPFSYAAYAHVRDNSRSYASLTATPQMILRFAYSDGTRVERSNAALVGTNYFSTLAVQPQLGHLSFGSTRDTEATASVVLADGFWRRLGAGFRPRSCLSWSNQFATRACSRC